MLWDDADKKYGYINNFTGEVTQEYPTGNKPKKQTKLETESYRKNVVDLNKGMFFKNSLGYFTPGYIFENSLKWKDFVMILADL